MPGALQPGFRRSVFVQISMGSDSTQFGELLRFWRSALGQSQEDLAHGIDISTRHLSFLETGRSHPSRALIERIITHFGLRARDAGNLLLSAGLLPHSEAVDLNSPGQEELRSGLVATLRSLDPFPAAAIDPCANVKLVNRAWLHMHRRLFSDSVLGAQINTIRLLVAEDGWRKYLTDWADQACFYLLILKQEAILRNSREAAELLEDILRTSGLPPDWAARGARRADACRWPQSSLRAAHAGRQGTRLHQRSSHGGFDHVRVGAQADHPCHPARGWHRGHYAGAAGQPEPAASAAGNVTRSRELARRRADATASCRSCLCGQNLNCSSALTILGAMGCTRRTAPEENVLGVTCV